MIPFTLQPEPQSFDKMVRQKGAAWLRDTPDAIDKDRPQNYWKHCLPELRRAFRGLCAYAAMRVEAKGTVDHFRSWAKTKATNPELAYEWHNYRFSSFAINCLKNQFDEDVLDPFEVRDGWFRVSLPDMQLVLTERVPAHQRALAAQTLQRLQLGHGEDLVQFRRAWYDEFKRGGASVLAMMEDWAPLVASAIQEKLATGEPLP